MTGEEMKAIRARADAASEPPWGTQVEVEDDPTGFWRVLNESLIILDTAARVDAEFVAHARQDIPDLLDALADPATAAATVRDCLLSKGDPDTAGIVQAFIDTLEDER